VEQYGLERVEKILDSAMSLAPHMDIYKGLNRSKFKPHRERKVHYPDPLLFDLGMDDFRVEERIKEYQLPERDLLWFLVNYAPLEDWEIDILEMVREEQYYFLPFLRTKIMNEGYAMWSQFKIMADSDILTDAEYLDFLRMSAMVASSRSGFNPYWFGLVLWNHIEKKHGEEEIYKVRDQEEDYSFILNYLDKEFVKKHKLLVYTYEEKEDEVELEITSKKVDKIRQVLAQTYLPIFATPKIEVIEVGKNREMVMKHFPPAEEIELKPDYAEKTLNYMGRLWKADIKLIATKNGKQGFYKWDNAKEVVLFHLD